MQLEELLTHPVSELRWPMTPALADILEDAGIFTLGDLVSCDDAQLLCIRGIGDTRLTRIDQALQDANLHRNRLILAPVTKEDRLQSAIDLLTRIATTLEELVKIERSR